jgi:hypothetical protein
MDASKTPKEKEASLHWQEIVSLWVLKSYHPYESFMPLSRPAWQTATAPSKWKWQANEP